MKLPTLAPALFLLLFATASIATAEERPPNVLFLISDDLNADLGCYGHPLVKTPHIDRLAARGVRFERAYCNYPLCGPSRNSMLTGLYPNRNGILKNREIFRETIPEHVSLSQAFRHAGYLAARIGKLYHYNVPASVGTDGDDDPASWELAFNPAGVDLLIEEPDIFTLVPGNFGSVLSWYASPRSDEQHTDGMIATEADWLLERCAREPERPFFLAVGFFRPHTPFLAPKDPYFDRYPVEDMPLADHRPEDDETVPAAALASRKREEEKLTDELSREAIQAYYASISFMDAQVGRVLDSLERHGLADNTIVVFASDHGYHLGEHGLWKKQSLFEESARVPLVIATPGTDRAGAVAEAPVALLDLYPTLTELCGVDAPANLQGQSLVPLLNDPTATGRGWALTQMVRGGGRGKSAPLTGYSLRTERWRYSEWNEGERGRLLYDHDADPKERRNLAGDPAQADTVAELSARLREAVRASYPENGEIPAKQEKPWAPELR